MDIRECEKKYDVVIVGAGVAGLNCALHLPPGKRVLLLCKREPSESDSCLAQGGICMMRGRDDFDGYFEDTMRAGHYENNPATVRCMLDGSEAVIDGLVGLGVRFARDGDGNFRFTREGGHRRPRILFHEDCTGLEITTKLYGRVTQLDNVTLCPQTTVLDILEEEGMAAGVVARDNASGEWRAIYSDYTVLATGGVGGLFHNSTNYRSLTGDALAICLRHGVRCDHLDYVQIHPTTLYSRKNGRRFLISESVRGEGAVLLNAAGERFTDELQPRDVVTAAIREQMQKDRSRHVWLDLRPVGRDALCEHFPTIVRKCAEEGHDVFSAPVPVVPSQHYFMGGIRSDLRGRTTMPRLYAVGETCCNGVHGRNRLASNSLLESLLFAERAAQDIGAGFEPLPLSVSASAEGKLAPETYDDAEGLLLSYHGQVLREMEKEKDESDHTEIAG